LLPPWAFTSHRIISDATSQNRYQIHTEQAHWLHQEWQKKPILIGLLFRNVFFNLQMSKDVPVFFLLLIFHGGLRTDFV
jgi:hypothetical protein